VLWSVDSCSQLQLCGGLFDLPLLGIGPIIQRCKNKNLSVPGTSPILPIRVVRMFFGLVCSNKVSAMHVYKSHSTEKMRLYTGGALVL
jgi:hypothetical protein